jgi:cation:H+ antiporter
MTAVLPISLAVPLFVVGVVILVKGADVFTDGATRLARALRVSGFVIGVTLVAVATSLPELGVSGVGAVRDAGGIAVGNALGSNVANVAFVLGVAVLIVPIVANWFEMRRDVLFMLVVIAIGAYIISDKVIQRWEALAMVALYSAYLAWIIRGRKTKARHRGTSVGRDIYFKLIVGALAIYAGAELVILSVVRICEVFDIAQTAVGLTIVALSTSLPELAASVVAVRKGAMGLSVGNIVGSNIFNILMVLGVAGTLAPISISHAPWEKLMIFSIPLMFGLSLLLLALVKFGRIPRKIAPLLLLCYAIFVWVAYV